MQRSRGLTLVEIMIVTAILLLLTGLAVPNLVRMRILANDGLAQVTLRNISNSLESYLATHEGYPDSTDELVYNTPPYINKDYFKGTSFGFVFEDKIDARNYIVLAKPAVVGRTGSKSYSIRTGGVLAEGSESPALPFMAERVE